MDRRHSQQRTEAVTEASGAGPVHPEHLAGTAARPSGRAEAASSRAGKRPVFFVHGFRGYNSIFGGLKDELRKAGYSDSDFHDFSWSENDRLTPVANRFRDFVRQKARGEVDVVAHSTGTAITRYALKGHQHMLIDNEYNLLNPLGDQIRVWVGLAGLNYGTQNYGASVGGVWYPCLNDMKPSDQYMKNLNSGTHAPGPTRYLTYRSTSDEQLESWTIRLDGAENRDIYGVSHDGVPNNSEVKAGVVNFMQETPNRYDPELPPIGGTYLLKNVATGKFLDAGTAQDFVVQWPRTDSKQQKWTLEQGYADGIYVLRNNYYRGPRYLRGAPGQGATSGDSAFGYIYWQIKKAGGNGFLLYQDNVGKYLHIPHGDATQGKTPELDVNIQYSWYAWEFVGVPYGG
ncbi:RICIN domain-containing protein [Streptomyces carpaticus]|uniref:RICIN domain-containing protein n=1 Tax=Streptomyces carpaticus TaxID=285558 RepID=UPI0031F8E4B0